MLPLFDAEQQENISRLLLAEDRQNKLLGYHLLQAAPQNVASLKRVLCAATYLDNQFEPDVEGKLEELLQQNLPAPVLYQLQNEIIILDYARYKFKVKGGWHTPNNPLRKYLYQHEVALSKYLAVFAFQPARFAQYYSVLARRIQEELKSHHKALFYYEVVLSLVPDHKGAQFGYAKTIHTFYLKKGKRLEEYPKVKAYYLAAYKQPDQMLPYINAALLCKEMGDLEDSKALYEEALALNDQDTVLLNNYANLLFKEFGDWQQAKALAEKGMSIKADGYLLDTLATIEMLGFGNMEAAKILFERALNIDFNNHWSYTGLGDWYVLEGDFEAAAKFYKRGIFNENKFTTREKKDIIEKLQKLIDLYTIHAPNEQEARYYRHKMQQLQY